MFAPRPRLPHAVCVVASPLIALLLTLMARSLFAVALLACIASTASAYYKYPPGPGSACPDSVTIAKVQNTLAACHPAPNDTVLGVRGIIAGFRRLNNAEIYFVRSGTDPLYSGLMAYPQSHLENTNPYCPTLSIGDSISVDGTITEYPPTEIAGSLPNGVMKVRLINSGNPVPVRAATTTTIKWTPTSGAGTAFATADPLECCLVRVEGANGQGLKVARNTPGAGLYAGTNWLCVNWDGSAPGDSILIDGYRLPGSGSVLAPPLNSRIDWVQGLLGRGSNAGVNCWSIRLRDGNDMQALASPNLVNAYPIAEDTLRLAFDKKVAVASGEDEANYRLGSQLSGSSVDNARVVPGDTSRVDLAITEVLDRLDLESISCDSIGAQVSPWIKSPTQSLSFILGVLSCAEVQAPLADSLTGDPCLDKSRFSGSGSAWGPRVTVRGVMVKSYPVSKLQFIADAAGGLRSGVVAYNVPFGMVVGNEYLLAANVQEFYGMTEVSGTTALIDKGASAVPAAVKQKVGVLIDASCDANEETLNADDYEGMLVKLDSVKVVPWNYPPTDPAAGGSFRVVQLPACADTIQVNGYNGLYTFDADPGDQLEVKGVLYIDTGYGIQVWPRDNSDITLIRKNLGVPGTVSSRVAFSVGPSPSRVTNVRFTLPKQADVDLSVFDLAGRKVATLVKGSLAAKSYEYKWNGAGAGAGIYFVRLRAGSETYNLRTVTLR